MNELIINNRRVDLSESTNIGLTFSANNIGELQNRQGNFSNTFKLPITKINKEIFEWSHLQNSSSSMPYQKLKATYKQDGIEIVSDGVAEISNVDNNFFYVNVYSGNVDLMEAIGDLQVGDLYSDSSHVWSLNYPFASTLNSSYFIYPLIDWRTDIDTFFDTNTIDVRQMLPSMVIFQMFDRLAERIGYNFGGNYLNSVNHKSMILTPNSFSIPKSDAVKTSNQLSVIGTTGGTNISSGSAISTVTYMPTFRNENNISDFAFGVFQPNINKVGRLKFVGEYQIKWIATESKLNENTKNCIIDLSIIDDLNNTIYGPIKSGPYTFKKDANISEIFTIDCETNEITFLSSRKYRVQIDCRVEQKNVSTLFYLYEYPIKNEFPIGFFTPGNTTTDVLPHYFQFTPSPKIAYGSSLDFTNIFTMKVKDVLKDILNMEGIIIQTNNYTKTIQFNKFEDVILNKQISKDWSRKIQSSKSMSFKFGNYAKKNNVKFKTESDKDGYFTLTNDSLEVERDVIKFGHDATIQSSDYKYQGFVIPKINGLKDSTNEWYSPSWRLLYTKVQNTYFDVNYTDGTTTIPKSDNIPFCFFKDANTLIEENYSSIISVLNNPKVLKIIANLDVTDISDLDFSIPIQINRPDLNLSGYFYINKIENYNGNLTSCEIIEI